MSIINFWDLIYHIIIDFKFILLKKKGSLNIDFNMGKMSIINFWDLIYHIIIDFKFILCFFTYIGNFKTIPWNQILLAIEFRREKTE